MYITLLGMMNLKMFMFPEPNRVGSLLLIGTLLLQSRLESAVTLPETTFGVLRKRLPCCRSIISPLSMSSRTSTRARSSAKSFIRYWWISRANNTNSNNHNLVLGARRRGSSWRRFPISWSLRVALLALEPFGTANAQWAIIGRTGVLSGLRDNVRVEDSDFFKQYVYLFLENFTQ